MGNSARAVIDRKQRFVAALSAFMELLDKKSKSRKENREDEKQKSKTHAFCGGNDDSGGERNLLCMESREEEKNRRYGDKKTCI